ncbi:hypothetical protein SRHO_G00059450 [Serrasalmus rhombeus]
MMEMWSESPRWSLQHQAHLEEGCCRECCPESTPWLRREDEHEEVSQPPQLIPLGVPAGVLTVNLKTCRDFSKSAPLKKGSRAAVRITIGRTVKYTVQQPYSDPMCFDEWKHFSLQIQKEDICGVQQSSLVVVELSL